MPALVVCDAHSVAAQLRALLVRHGRECPLSHVVSLEAAPEAVAAAAEKPELTVLVENGDHAGLVPTISRLRAATPGKIVVLGPADDPQHILRAIHAGADDYLDASSDLEAELESLLGRLDCTDRRASPPAQTIAVTSASGGSGRSLLAVNVAVALARWQGRCGLIDLNLSGGDLAALLNLRPRYTVVDLCRNACNLDQEMFAQALAHHDSGVELLAAPATHAELDEVHVQAVNQIVQRARATFPHVVVDLEDHFHREQVRLLRASDVVLAVLRPDFVSLRNTRRALEEFDRGGIDRARLRLVLNRAGHAKELSRADVEAALGLRVAHVVPDDPRSVLPSVNFGLPVVLESPASPVARALEEIARAIAPGTPAPDVAAQAPAKTDRKGVLARVYSAMGM